MSLTVRRIVTGHNSQGRPVVLIDTEMNNVVSRRNGQLESQIWSTDADCAKGVDSGEGELRKADTRIASGTVFRVVNYAPGVASFPHRNDWIDYTIVIAGEIDMQLDEKTEVHLKAGDRCHSQSTHTCCATPVGSSSPTMATTREPCNTTSGTRTACTVIVVQDGGAGAGARREAAARAAGPTSFCLAAEPP